MSPMQICSGPLYLNLARVFFFFSKFGATGRNANHQLFWDMQKKVKRVRHANVDLFDG